MFASIAGTVISVFVILFFIVIIIGGAFAAAMSDFDKSSQVTKVEQNSILHIKLDQPIVDRGPEEQFNFNFGPFASASSMGLDQILNHLEQAKSDDKIDGIFLDLSYLSGGMGTMEEIRNGLIDFKKSGKWVISYSEGYSQKAYYLASVSDEIYVYPEGSLDFRGLSVNISFLKGMLEKLEIEPQIIRGSNNKFKSAIEPLILDGMSQANRAQTEQWMGTIWDNMLAKISDSRNIPTTELQAIADEFRVQTAEDAVEQGLATGVAYYDEILSELHDRTNVDSDDDLNFITLKKYFKAPSGKKEGVGYFKKDKIAVIYASGGINSGKSSEGEIGSETYAKAIREARLDTSIKAIVLRVNSGGGSALASDVIWRETVLAKAEKPFVVSMGDVAASGGYYISAAADKIFAMPNTITGSIGVFGVIPNFQGFMNNKMGVTFDGVKTADHADFGGVMRPLTEKEYDIFQTSVDNIYGDFIGKVGDGRDMTTAAVDEIGQGRVWSGTDALEIGLVDELGGLKEAIDAAAELAGLEDYATKNFPKIQDPLEKFLEDMNMQINAKLLAFQFGEDVELISEFEHIMEIKNLRGMQARMLFDVNIK